MKLPRIFRKRKKMLVIGLDGFPCSLLRRYLDSGGMPFLREFMQAAPPLPMTSILPTVSSVAWATFMTGRNPGGHNIYGFIDRKLSPFKLYIPTHSNMGAPTLWRRLSDAGKKVIVMNVPVTYPPEPVNGILVSGFLGVRLQRITYPESISSLLESNGYIIDADTSIPRSGGKAAFLENLHVVMSRRFTSFMQLLAENSWDYAHLHVMETDRLFHFLWSAAVGEADEALNERTRLFFKDLDGWLERLLSAMPEDMEVVILSDHGFTKSHTEFQVNTFLADNGFLKWTVEEGVGLHRIHPGSLAYSLIPGRIYINLKGREPSGSVPPSESDAVAERIEDALRALTIPGTDTPVVTNVHRRDAVFSGQWRNNAPDIIAVPAPGVELKGKLAPETLFSPGELEGTHTYDDAFLWCKLGELSGDSPRIIDCNLGILEYFGVSDSGSESRPLFQWRKL